MLIRTFTAVAAIAAITLIAYLAFWPDRPKTTDVGSSSVASGTTEPGPTPPSTPLPRLYETVPGLGSAEKPGPGNLAEMPGFAKNAEPETLPAAPAILPLASAPASPAESVPPTAPDSPTQAATAGAARTPPMESVAVPQQPAPPERPPAPPVIARLSPHPAVSDNVARMQIAASMQGLEPGPPIDLPIRLGQGQRRTIYFFTELRGLNGRSVVHRWEWNGRVMQERQLRPASQSWRAYTAMAITGNMQGSWRLAAIDATTGQVLAEQRFQVD